MIKSSELYIIIIRIIKIAMKETTKRDIVKPSSVTSLHNPAPHRINYFKTMTRPVMLCLAVLTFAAAMP